MQNFLLVVSLDSNEHIRAGSLVGAFRGLGLVDMITSITNKLPLAFHITESQPLDAVQTTSNLKVISMSICHYSFSIGNYRAIIVDIARDSLLGASTISILPLTMR